MKVVATSDWREGIAYDSPTLVAEILPGEDTHCSVCGGDSPLVARTELWAVKHRHPKHHSGHVRFYCRAHVPVVAQPESPGVKRERAAARTERRPPQRRPLAPEKPAAVCPNCFIEIPPTGVCGKCGYSIL